MRRPTDCLVVVDMQNDLMPGGALAAAGQGMKKAGVRRLSSAALP